MLYVKDSLISSGGMSSVYSGYSDKGQKVAIKQIPASVAYDPVVRDMFFAEANSLLRMNHPDVVKVLDDPFDDAEGNLYLPMEFVEGKTITQRVKEKGRFPEKKAVELMSKILDAFTYIHSLGIVHRDVKPSNIMLRPDGSICVIDFGIVKASRVNSAFTVGKVIGTDGYMSPEQAAGLTVDYRSDIYSLGCLLHFMVTGLHAFNKEASDYATIHSVLYERFPRAKDIVPSLSEHIQDVIFTATKKNMLERYQSVQHFKAALNGEVYQDPSTVSHCISIGRSGADVLVYGAFVSSHHLDVDYVDGNIVITDHSRNGTSVDGRYLKNGTILIPFKITSNIKKLPRVFLAGREECEVPWNNVISMLRKQKGI